MKSEFLNFFSRLQHGVATEGGNLLLHHIQLLTVTGLKTGAKNALNSIPFATTSDRTFPIVTSHVKQIYSGFGPLIFLQNNVPGILSSQEGIHQEDPLGPVLFSLGIQQTLVDLQSKFSKQ